MRPLVHNPAFLSVDERIRQFWVRQDELRDIVRAIRGNTGPANQHVLVLGGRGLGKSTLVQRAIAEVHQTALGERWVPLALPEDPYQIANIGEFWLEALRCLADQTEDPRWSGLYQQLHREHDVRRLELTARAALKEHADKSRRRILLVVENLDMLLGQLEAQDAWALRSTLQTDPTFMLLATALRPFEAITDHRQPFYEGFRRIELRPLSVDPIGKL